MSPHIHHLRGCAPAPLAHYLKALGILRLVAEQADPTARLWWQDEHACLATTLDAEALNAFFCDAYRPTPMVAPWNGGSGFYPKDNRTGLDAIVAHTHPRFAEFRAALLAARALVGTREESPKDDDKAHLIAACRAAWRGGLGRWLATAIVIDHDLSPRYPALLGTGGNDGRLNFTNNFMQRLTELIAADGTALPVARGLAGAALFGGPARGLTAGKAISQFLPGGAGGANSTVGFNADSLLNPWDFILMLEGAVLWAAAAARRLGSSGASMITAPFALRAQSAGHGTAAGSEDAPRGEQWMPLWSQAAGLDEVAAFLAEGRLSTVHGPAQRPLDAARAIARLGTARGIDAFQRFGYFARNGQANLAIPLGRW
jgi:CRISPR-associated protein Csx17